MSESCIKVLTLNCWGLKYVAKNRTERIKAIASELSRSSYDIVALQELWVFSDFELVRSWVSKRLPFAKFFYSGALGAGLALFSRFPITAATIHPYSLNGHPIDVSAGDWFVGKAAASIVVRHPLLGELEVFNTHLFAKGGETGPEHLRAHRLINAWELAKLIRLSTAVGRHVIAAGDFNSIPSTLPMTIIREHAGLSDAWEDSHGPNSSISVSHIDFSAADAITQFGVTADSPLNSYSAGKPLDVTARRESGKRLDYILYRQSCAADLPKSKLVSRQSRVVFTDKVPGHQFSHSDHFGLETTFDIIPLTADEPCARRTESFLQSTSPLSDDSLRTVISALTSCYRVSSERSQTELSLFALCAVMLVAVAIGSAWLPRSWLNPIFILFTVFISWLGTTMFYAGFLYGNWERRALMNVIEEMELVRAFKSSDFGDSTNSIIRSQTGVERVGSSSSRTFKDSAKAVFFSDSDTPLGNPARGLNSDADHVVTFDPDTRG